MTHKKCGTPIFEESTGEVDQEGHAIVAWYCHDCGYEVADDEIEDTPKD